MYVLQFVHEISDNFSHTNKSKFFLLNTLQMVLYFNVSNIFRILLIAPIELHMQGPEM